LHLSISAIGLPDTDTMATFMREMLSRPPPTGVSTPFVTTIVWLRKHTQGFRLHSSHQNLWAGAKVSWLSLTGNLASGSLGVGVQRFCFPPQLRWHLVLFNHVLEDGVPVPPPHKNLASSSTQAVSTTRLSAASFQPMSVDPPRPKPKWCPLTHSHLPASPSLVPTHQRVQHVDAEREEASATTPDLEEVLHALRSPAPELEWLFDLPADGSSLLDERWLHSP
jgi:hypothetical protein